MVALAGLEKRFAREFSEAVQPLFVECAEHRAAGFAFVATVCEPARGGEFRDVVEGRADRIVVARKPELAHARRVDDRGAVGEAHQLPPRGGVAAAVVVARGTRGQPPLAEQRIDQRRLARTARAHEGQGLRRSAKSVENFEPGALERADGEDGPPVRDAACRADVLGRIVREVGFGQRDRRVHVARFGAGEITLDAAHIEIAIAGNGDEQRVDVRGDRLQRGDATRTTPREEIAARQERAHDGERAAGCEFDGDIIADGG